jgi:hypothetical protein
MARDFVPRKLKLTLKTTNRAGEPRIHTNSHEFGRRNGKKKSGTKEHNTEVLGRAESML